MCGELGVGTPGASVGFEFGEGVTSGPEGGSFEVGAEIGAKIENPLIEAGASASSSVNIYDPEKGELVYTAYIMFMIIGGLQHYTCFS